MDQIPKRNDMKIVGCVKVCRALPSVGTQTHLGKQMVKAFAWGGVRA